MARALRRRAARPVTRSSTKHRAASVFVLALGLSSWAVQAQVTEHQPKILFDGIESPDKTQIYVMDPDGSHVRSLTGQSPGRSGFAAWSPDRQKIAFMSDRDGEPEVYVMAADGSDVQRLTSRRGLDGFPVWSPDGNQIAFVRDTDPPATGPLFPPRSQSVYVMVPTVPMSRGSRTTTRSMPDPRGRQMGRKSSFTQITRSSSWMPTVATSINSRLTTASGPIRTGDRSVIE